MVVTPTLSSFVEAANEYVDDPYHNLARSPNGQVLRMKLKVTLSYKPATSYQSVGIFRNTHVHLQLPPNVYTEQTMFKFENMNFQGR